MRFPLSMTSSIAGYVVKKKLARTKKFPMVLMLEPLHACNLTCTGCGRIREYESTIKQKLSIQECLESVDECGAPVVSICGGEPMIYPGIDELVAKILERKKVVYLCTNTTVFKETDMAELDELYGFLTSIDVDGFMIAPGYGYSAVADQDMFLTREDIRTKFRAAEAMFRKYKFNTSPIYLEFLQGKREMSCTAWGNPTRNIKGWKGPCYLITDIHHNSFDDLLNKTPWEKYGYGKDPRCENCMVHSGYEASAALGVNSKLGDTFKMIKWQFT